MVKTFIPNPAEAGRFVMRVKVRQLRIALRFDFLSLWESNNILHASACFESAELTSA
jgi:hypothetical protein